MYAIYTRQSINKKDSVSIETQIEICKKEIPVNAEVKVYSDKGFSGKNTDRPAFQQLIDDIKRGLIEYIVVYRLDRISRSVVDFANIMDTLNAHNVNFISANEKFDTSTPVGKAMLYIIMIFAQLERETIAERIKDNYYQRGTQGVWLGGPAPFGFKNNKVIGANGKKIATIEPTEDLVLVKRIFEWYAEDGVSLGVIARQLTSERKESWNNIKLSRILHNPAYVMADIDIYNYYKSKDVIIESDVSEFNGFNGLNLYGKRNRSVNKYNSIKDHHLTVSTHKGIISSELFLKCQYKLVTNKQIKNSGTGKHTWLTGLVKCGYCGHALVAKAYRNGSKYLACSGRAIGICPKEKCVTHCLTEVEAAVAICLREYYIKLINCTVEAVAVSDDTSANNVKQQIYKVEQNISNLVNSLTEANDIAMKYINAKLKDLDKKKSELYDQLSALQVKKAEVLQLPNISLWDNKDKDYKHKIAATLIDRVLIYENNIEIFWKI
jgi:DNA invertase Pin-like site-specific DNA recombinase